MIDQSIEGITEQEQKEMAEFSVRLNLEAAVRRMELERSLVAGCLSELHAAIGLIRYELDGIARMASRGEDVNETAQASAYRATTVQAYALALSQSIGGVDMLSPFLTMEASRTVH